MTDDRTNMIFEMEKKLNPSWFARHNRSSDDFATLSVAQYWDWLTYIDVCTLLSPLTALFVYRRMTTLLSGKYST